jgi:hypothetical protein
VSRLRTLIDAYLALFATAIGLFVLEEAGPSSHVVETYVPNLVAELVGILVTVLFIERLLAWRRQEQLAPIRAAAARRLQVATTHLFGLMMAMYKAAAPAGTPPHDSPAAVLDAWAEEVERLDMKREPPGIDSPDWASHLSTALRPIQESLEDTIGRYPEALGTDVIVSVEQVLDHPLWTLMKNLGRITSVQASMNLNPPVEFLLALHSPGKAADLVEFTDRVKALVSVCARLGTPVALSHREWDDDVAPAFGSGRWDGSFEELDDPRTYLPRGPSAELPRHQPATPGPPEAAAPPKTPG